MGQIELPDCTNTIQVSRKVYSNEELEEMVKVWSTGQVAIMGMAIGSAKNDYEISWIKAAIGDALNHPEVFNSPNDTFGALNNLRGMIKNKNAVVLRARYGIPVKLEYRNTLGVNAIVDVNHEDNVIIPLTASEILDIIVDLNKNRNVEDIYYAYEEEFYHETMTIEYLESFQELYQKGKLNNIIRFICHKSNELGGFKDYGVDVIRNRLTSQYLFDNRRM